ncbi:MAG: SusC/RagA family TonB-linked outer membrane protein [Bacteroidales bacterium]
MKKHFLILVLLLIVGQLYAQHNVKGTITSSKDGQSIPGVTIIVKGATEGGASDLDGKYSIQVSNSNDSLIFSCIGYKTLTIPISGRSVINVSMSENNLLLDQVVVMGYSSKSKKEITSAVTVVSAEKLKGVTSPNIGNMLEGKVAGVSVVSGSGAPGSVPSIRIRGVSSMNAPQEPLYVVDGIIGGAYDPNDVETITVLKDAGATGMYGAQANGGVILITTKKAKTKGLKFDFKASYGITQPDFARSEYMNSNELYNYYREYFRDPETHIVDDIQFNNSVPASVLDTDTDWLDEIFSTGTVQNYYLSLSGMSDKISYYASASYYNEDGAMENTGYKQFNIRSNNTYRPTNSLTITSNVALSASKSEEMDDNVLYYLLKSIPWDNPYDVDGNVRPFADADDVWNRDKINPLLAFEGNNLKNENKSFSLDYDLSVNWKINNWLSFVTQNRISASTNKYHYHRTKQMEYMQGGDNITETQTFNYGGITTNMLKADYEFGKNSISGLVGYEAQTSRSELLSASGEGLPEGLYVLNSTSSNPIVGGYNSKTAMQSLISQFNYNYNLKYFLTGSFRIDQSSTFNKDNRTAYFPSLSGSWLVSSEPFMENIDFITDLKLKASWGITGMKDIGASKYLESFAYSTQYNSNIAALATQMANPDLKWEQTTQTNLGLEFTLFDRFTINTNYYYNITNDLLVYKSLPPSGGFDAQWQNLGSDKNTGFDFSISADIIKTHDFLWNADFSISYNYNELSGFKGDKIYSSDQYGVTQVYEDGASLYTWYLKEYKGIDPETGKLQYIDEDGNITDDYASARFTSEKGSALAPWQGGFSTSLKYKNITLSATGSFVWGNKLYGRRRASNLSLFVEGSLKPSDEDVLWKQPGDEATIGAPTYASAFITHSGFLVDGSYFKLRNVSVTYDIPKKLTGKYGVSLGLSCDNLLTLTNVWGGDPEVSIAPSLYSLPGMLSADASYRYPNTRKYVLQVKLTF